MKKRLCIVLLIVMCGAFTSCDKTQEAIQATSQPTAEPTAPHATQVDDIITVPSQKEEVTEQTTEPPQEVESKPKVEYQGTLNEHERAEIEGLIDKIERLTDD